MKATAAIGRIPVRHVQPAVECGRRPAKAVVGETFLVSATVFREGHDAVAANAVLRDPLKLKALQKGLAQLCEEGATQLFRPLQSNDLILGAIGPLQFEVASYRLQDEYGVDCAFEAINVVAARWIHSTDPVQIEEFTKRLGNNLARDHSGALVYLAPTTVSLNLTQERWPKIEFRATREHRAAD